MNGLILLAAILNTCYALRPAFGVDTRYDLVPGWVCAVAAAWGFGYLMWLA